MWRTGTIISMLGPISSIELVALRSDPPLDIANGAGILPEGEPDCRLWAPQVQAANFLHLSSSPLAHQIPCSDLIAVIPVPLALMLL